jgi:hypothetical protein
MPMSDPFDNQTSDPDINTFEERADHIDEAVLRDGTARGDYFDKIHKELTSRGLVLLVGPRGCGKTHLMRYTWLQCRDNKRLPFAVYVSFNRYYRLEPLLKSRADAIQLFHLWVLSRILEGLFDGVRAVDASEEGRTISDDEAARRTELVIGFEIIALKDLIAALERGTPLRAEHENLAARISTESVVSLIDDLSRFYNRSHGILLLDDAALVLTPEYLAEFFDIVRVLKRTRIAPKASVYPGTTEYGPRFHAQHEGRQVVVWLSTEDSNYRDVMGAIAQRRYPQSAEISAETNDLFKYAAFGIPRAYLTMLRDYKQGNYSTPQQGINQIIIAHRDARLDEYKSLALKMPRLETAVKTGQKLFEATVEAVREANLRLAGKAERQTLIGIPETDLTPMILRMVNLLIEAGLVYEHSTVSHGEERSYRRYTPHFAALMAVRAFSEGSRGFSSRQIVENLGKRLTKHPIRRRLQNLLTQADLQNLRLDLPPCEKCGASRLSESQKFCHNCGAELVDTSTFGQCMALSLAQVPGLTGWQLEQMTKLRISTIGDLLSIQDPGTELRQIRWVGDRRAKRILDRVTLFVDEFLS